MDQNTLLNVKQVAQYLQLKESTIYSWAQDGKIPAIKIGRTWRFRRSDLDSWLERHLQGESLEDATNEVRAESRVA
ncbi:MAG TPA: helix-turn-helix domain-containing protein [Chloroflexi bacterium]|jgi:excisionase family DNA binding protein|nr:helix-turn-helix domain-containing protein [Chloroflexota bacterium]